MGIDYGTKRIGIAFSDERGLMAFPHDVLDNDGNIVDIINSLAQKEEIEKIVIGDPGENSIKEDVQYLKKELSKFGFDVQQKANRQKNQERSRSQKRRFCSCTYITKVFR
jgi:putative Holliday junction resolvase